jgi:hypothetical protein
MEAIDNRHSLAEAYSFEVCPQDFRAIDERLERFRVARSNAEGARQRPRRSFCQRWS